MNQPQIISNNDQKVKEALGYWTHMHLSSTEDLGESLNCEWMCGSAGAWGSFIDDATEELNHTIAEAVETILNDEVTTTISQRLAVHHFHLAAVYQSNRSNIENDYANALQIIEFGLRKRYLLY